MYGAWRLARLDAGAMAWFDRSVGGVWRSFWAMALAYPAVILLVILRPAPEQAWAFPSLHILLIESTTYVIEWTGFLLATVELCRWLRREEECLDFIVAYNWWQVLQTGLMLAAIVIGRMLPPIPGILLPSAVQLALLANEWFIARFVLKAGALAATAILLLDVVISLAVGEFAQNFH